MLKFKNDIFWMKKAIRLAKGAEKKGEVPVGAILVYQNKILAKAYNQSIFYNDPCAHAEILALRIAGKRVKNYRLNYSTLYVTLEPCIMCAGALIHARIFRLVFGAKNKNNGAAGTIIDIFNDPKINHNIIISKGILSDQCKEVLNCFFRKKRKK